MPDRDLPDPGEPLRRVSPAAVVIAFALAMTACVLGVVAWKALDAKATTLERGQTDIQNLAHLIHFRGCLVLHVGDAQLDAMDYAPYGLKKRKIDVALLPFWYFLEEQDCFSVRDWLGAKHYVAMHIPPKDFAEVRCKVAANMPGVVMLEKGGDATRIDVK